MQATPNPSPAADSAPTPWLVRAEGLRLAPGDRTLLQGLNFEVRRGEVFVIVGESGCGKSVLLRHLIGLHAPAEGRVWLHLSEAAVTGYAGVRAGEHDLYACDAATLAVLRRQFGVMFQAGALWSSLTVGENLLLPLRLFSSMPKAQWPAHARAQLALVGLEQAYDLAPAALSGGMRKRVAIARAMVLQPALLYLDEPASGLDPVNTRALDELILSLRRERGTTVVMVTHAIDSLFAVADRALFLSAKETTMLALDSPHHLLHHGPQEVRDFLRASHPGAAAR